MGLNPQLSLRTKYETVAASQTAQVMGATGAIGDVIERIIIVPEATNAGTIALLDGTNSTNIFVTGTLADLTPIVLELGMVSTVGAWKVTTGASVHCFVIGQFS